MDNVRNVVAVARREFTVRVRTRSFLIGTAVLVIGVVALALVPVIIGYFDRSGSEKVGVAVVATDLPSDPVAAIDRVLNGSGADPASALTGTSDSPRYLVSSVPDVDAGRADVREGRLSALVAISRDGDGDLAFAYYTADAGGRPGRTSVLIQQAANALTIADRLERLGIAPGDQATLFAPASFSVRSADPARPEVNSDAEAGANYLLGFGTSILVFMMIILYGNWVAMSVVEEKSSRVMEVVLNAATPFQLLSGKVLGVGAVALVQYAALLVAGIAALLLQGPIADAVLGSGGGSAALPAGLTVGVLALLGLYGVLGFLLYAVLYAAAGSLVSRQEDLSQAVMPMALISTVGYLIAVYASTGLLDIRSGWIAALSQVPLFSPFMMLSRVVAGEAAIWEVPLSVVLLVASIFVALRIAARIYAAGVLLYGQRPGIRAVWRLVRSGG